MVWQVTLGDLAQTLGIAAVIISAYFALKGQLNSFKQTLETHADTLTAHSARMDLYESRILDLVASLQRLMGQSDVRWKDR